MSTVCSSPSLSASQIEYVNECRLDALGHAGIPITVDARAVLDFLFDRTLGTGTAREFRRNWITNVAGLLDDIENRVTRTRLDLVHQRVHALGRPPIAKVA